ncbi:MAG: membrane dipeptidase [Gemmatimonadales bacterium]
MSLSRLLITSACLAAGVTPLVAQTPADANLAHARRLLAQAILIDGHNDLPWEIRTSKDAPMDVAAYDLRTKTKGMTDFARLAAGGLSGQFWSIYIPGEIKDSGFARVQLEQFDIARRMVARYPDRMALALTADDIVKAKKQKKVASLLGMEGGHAIENSLGALRVYYELGARYMTLTHNVTLDWADAALGEQKHGGLTPFGKEVVREMNRLGMLVDLSHVAPSVMSDALTVSEAPVIFSHSSARAIVDYPRNVPDSILARLPSRRQKRGRPHRATLHEPQSAGARGQPPGLPAGSSGRHRASANRRSSSFQPGPIAPQGDSSATPSRPTSGHSLHKMARWITLQGGSAAASAAGSGTQPRTGSGTSSEPHPCSARKPDPAGWAALAPQASRRTALHAPAAVGRGSTACRGALGHQQPRSLVVSSSNLGKY